MGEAKPFQDQNAALLSLVQPFQECQNTSFIGIIWQWSKYPFPIQISLKSKFEMHLELEKIFLNSNQQFSLQNVLYTSNRIYSQCVCFSTVFLVLGYPFATWFHVSFWPPFQVACCFPEQRAMSTKSCLRSKKQCRHEQKTNMNILLVPKGSSKKAIQQTVLYYRSSQQSRKSVWKLRGTLNSSVIQNA